MLSEGKSTSGSWVEAFIGFIARIIILPLYAIAIGVILWLIATIIKMF